MINCKCGHADVEHGDKFVINTTTPRTVYLGCRMVGCECIQFVEASDEKCSKLRPEDLNSALLEIDRIERELKTIGGRLSVVKADLKSKLTSQVG